MSKKMSRTRGASNTEYGLLVGLVSVVAIVSVVGLGDKVDGLFRDTAGVLADGEAPSEAGEETPAAAKVEEPVDPYAEWRGEGYLYGTPDVDILKLADGGPWLGVYGLESDDDIDGTSASEVFIPGKGNDTVDSSGGDDTFVYARGDGADSFKDAGGIDRMIFLDIPSTEAEFLVGQRGNIDLEINVPDGSVWNRMFFYNNRSWEIESIEFSDGVVFDPGQTANKAVNDAKPYGEVKLTPLDEQIVHNDATDGSYVIRQNLSTANTMTFADTTFDEATFSASNGGRDLVVNTQSGDKVTIQYFLSDSAALNMSRWAELNFEDGPRPPLDVFLRRVAEDQKPNGTVYFTGFDDSLRHWASTDPSYQITGLWTGNDALALQETSFSEAKLGISSTTLIIKDRAGNKIEIPTYFHKSVGNWIETITFKGENPGFAAIKDRAIHDQKPAGRVLLTDYDDELRITSATDDSMTVDGNAGGTDTLSFTDVAFADAKFRDNNGYHLLIRLPGGEEITLPYTLNTSPYSIKKFERFVFSGVEVSHQDIIDRINEPDIYTFTKGDPHMWILDEELPNELHFTDLNRDDVHFMSGPRRAGQVDGTLLIMDLNGGSKYEAIDITGQLRAADDWGVDFIQFANGERLDRSQIRQKFEADPDWAQSGN